MQEQSNIFRSLPTPQMELVNKNDHLYRIYMQDGTYTAIEAHSVREAIDKSGVTSPVQIIPENMFIGYMLNEKEVRPLIWEETPKEL